MIMAPDRIAHEAMGLIGTRFRLHGRDPQTGLDCVGLVLTALRNAGLTMPDIPAYRLRNRSIIHHLEVVEGTSLRPVDPDQSMRAGDIILCNCGPAQHHLLIAAHGGGCVHAHAGLMRIVHQPGGPAWPVAAIFRANKKV